MVVLAAKVVVVVSLLLLPKLPTAALPKIYSPISYGGGGGGGDGDGEIAFGLTGITIDFDLGGTSGNWRRVDFVSLSDI